MEKKKLKLSITGSSRKTLSSIEQAKSQSKNAVFIERKAGRILRKPSNQKSEVTITLKLKKDKYHLKIHLLIKGILSRISIKENWLNKELLKDLKVNRSLRI